MRKKPLINKTCEYCGEIFHVHDTIRGNNRRFCSHKCSAGSRKKMIKCKTCEEKFHSVSGAIYCSLRCYQDSREVKGVDKICKQCRNIFNVRSVSYHKIFCSNDCNNKYHNKGSMLVECPICKIEFKVKLSTYKRSHSKVICCSRECYYEYRMHEPYGGIIYKYRDIDMRSTWECALAEKLDEWRYSWEYEPHIFHFEGTSYIPDFYLENIDTYIEVKGVMDKRSLLKIDLFRKYHPEKTLIVADKEVLKMYGVTFNVGGTTSKYRRVA